MEVEVGGEVSGGAIENRISKAIRARIRNFRDQADSITLENVRRIIEKDLGMEAFSLDAHKKIIKKYLEKCLDVSEEVSTFEDPAGDVNIVLEISKAPKDHTSMHENKVNDTSSLVNGVDGHETDKSIDVKTKGVVNEAKIKRAIEQKASYFRDNSEKLSLVEVRRLLERDLGLEKNALDPHKKFISQQLDEVLLPPEASKKHVLAAKKCSEKDTSFSKLRGSKKASRRSGSEDLSSSDASGSENEKNDQVKGKSKKRTLKNTRASDPRKKPKNTPKSRKVSTNGKQKKSLEEEDSDQSPEEAESHSSEEETVKSKKATPVQAYGKTVERLKSVIKSCGLGIPPTVYKRVKQAPEDKRESCLIKELKDILGKEGLSTNPSEKEVMAVRRKKEKAKELEGIDLSNIVSSTRRRSTTSFVGTPKPEIPLGSDEDEEEEEEEDDEEEEDEEEEDDEGDERNEKEEEEEDDESDKENNSSEAESEAEDEESD
ncbi:DNA ligase [Wolffia australiana]